MQVPICASVLEFLNIYIVARFTPGLCWCLWVFAMHVYKLSGLVCVCVRTCVCVGHPL